MPRNAPVKSSLPIDAAQETRVVARFIEYRQLYRKDVAGTLHATARDAGKRNIWKTPIAATAPGSGP